jgi:hypothetical protein
MKTTRTGLLVCSLVVACSGSNSGNGGEANVGGGTNGAQASGGLRRRVLRTRAIPPGFGGRSRNPATPVPRARTQ